MGEFDDYIKKAFSYLTCNLSPEQLKWEVSFGYTEDQVRGNLSYFKDCHERELSPYKALLFFHDYLIEKEYEK